MRVPKFLKMLMPIFVSLALLRAVNGAGALSLNEILVRLQSFEFSLDPVINLIDDVKQSSFDTFADVIQSVFYALLGFLKMLFELVKSTFALAGDLFGLVLYVAGFTS